MDLNFVVVCRGNDGKQASAVTQLEAGTVSRKRADILSSKTIDCRQLPVFFPPMFH